MQSVINGTFTADQAKSLVQNLNYGALPVPITLVSSQTIGASLARTPKRRRQSWCDWFFAHRYFPDSLVTACRSFGFHSLSNVHRFVADRFKLIPVTLSAAGIAGFILSIGMAVDANILIFER